MSASGQKHDYHLVDPSPWPLATSIATLVTAVGSVYYFHSKVMWAMVLGFLLIIYCAFMWFRDVVIEAEHKGHHTPVVQIHHRYGMTLFIASEVMFFVAWFWAYFDASLFPNEFMGNVWPYISHEFIWKQTCIKVCPKPCNKKHYLRSNK